MTQSISLPLCSKNKVGSQNENWLKGVINKAIEQKASDVHFEPFESCLIVRVRIDGAMQEWVPPRDILPHEIASCIKVYAGLDVAESRLPQDGRIAWDVSSGESVELRVSSLPTQFGESITVRILDKRAFSKDLAQLGMPPEILTPITSFLKSPRGLLLTTGPTGSGKTTTLYSLLNALNNASLKILTVEDPVEYDLDGIMQVHVRHDIGLHFAKCLKFFLRQDPDIILVGEIRDQETAKMCIQSSLTGHFVLSSVHTNDAVGAVGRLVDLGVEAYLVASVLEVVIAQRLLKKLCKHCRAQEPKRGWIEKGCSLCYYRGTLGRIPVFEMLRMSDALREAIYKSLSYQEMLRLAVADGYHSMRYWAQDYLIKGLCSRSEIDSCLLA